MRKKYDVKYPKVITGLVKDERYSVPALFEKKSALKRSEAIISQYL